MDPMTKVNPRLWIDASKITYIRFETHGNYNPAKVCVMCGLGGVEVALTVPIVEPLAIQIAEALIELKQGNAVGDVKVNDLTKRSWNY